MSANVNSKFDNYDSNEDENFTYYYPPMFRFPCGCYDDTRQPDPDPSTPPKTASPTQYEFQGEAGVLSPAYLQGYIKRFIGKSVRAQFLIGQSLLQDRTGVLTEVGASYIVLRAPQANTLIVCDVYSLRFLDVIG